ncbi:hypothetical protein Aut01nite_83750 [Actinoplanes utahensis]|nr:hypothetical protein Aut01nite_83750 [Actinoplanes utahensis]
MAVVAVLLVASMPAVGTDTDVRQVAIAAQPADRKESIEPDPAGTSRIHGYGAGTRRPPKVVASNSRSQPATPSRPVRTAKKQPTQTELVPPSPHPAGQCWAC